MHNNSMSHSAAVTGALNDLWNIQVTAEAKRKRGWQTSLLGFEEGTLGAGRVE
jgi:hypothetical protein